MKKLQIVLNVILVIAVGILFYMQMDFPAETGTIDGKSTEKVNKDAASAHLNVLYVNTDSVWTNFEYVNEIRANLERRQSQYKTELENKLKNFEKEVRNFQENVGTMSRFEAEQLQKELMQKEQDLQLLQEDLSYKLAEEEDKMKRDLRKKVLDYLSSYKLEDVDLILDYSASSNVLLINDSLDITAEVLTGLNDEYQKQKEVE